MIVGDTIMESRMMILDTAHTVRSGCTGADNVVVWSAAFDARVVDQDVQCAQVLAHGIDMRGDRGSWTAPTAGNRSRDGKAERPDGSEAEPRPPRT